MKGFCRYFIFVVAFTLLAAGCMTINPNVKVNWDGSAEYSQTVTYDSGVEDAAAYEQQITGLKGFFDQMGIEYVDIDGEGLKGIVATYKLDSIDMLMDSHTIWMLNNEMSLFGKDESRALNVAVTNYPFVKSVNVKGTIDLGSSDGTQPTPNFKISFDLPIGTSHHNATLSEQGGRRLSWDLPLGQPNPIELSFFVINLPALIMMVAILLLIAVIIAILVIAARKPTAPIVEDADEVDETYPVGEYDVEADENEFEGDASMGEIIEEQEFDNEAEDADIDEPTEDDQ